jgi:hypothetical protein
MHYYFFSINYLISTKVSYQHCTIVPAFCTMTMVLMGTIEGRSRYMASPDLTSIKQLSSSRAVQKAEPCPTLTLTMDMLRPHPRTRTSNPGRFGMTSYPAGDSSLTSGESDNSSSTSSTSRKRTSRARKLWIQQEVDVHQQIHTPIHAGYSLWCHEDDDDRSLSSLSGYGTDYSTSDGSVGFEGLCDAVESNNKRVVQFDGQVSGKSKIR